MQMSRFAETEQVYRDNLARLPENGWSLFGLAQSLHRQDKEEEAKAADAHFRKRRKDASDVRSEQREIGFAESLFCSLGLMPIGVK
jgi:hypothetical protein